MDRLLTGLQPSGSLTIGNYAGGISQIVNYQKDYETFLFVPDMHAITVPQDPDALHRNIINAIAMYIACGVDPDLPNMGRDKHGMPFYHPKQLNRVVRTTAYTHSESDHLAYGPRNAVGTRLKYNEQVRSAAADWSVYPLGTRFKIKGEPYIYEVDDYGSALVGTGTIDIYQPSRALMRKWGRRVVEIQIIQWGSTKRSMDYLAGRTRYRHCARMMAALQEQTRNAESAKN